MVVNIKRNVIILKEMFQVRNIIKYILKGIRKYNRAKIMYVGWKSKNINFYKQRNKKFQGVLGQTDFLRT